MSHSWEGPGRSRALDSHPSTAATLARPYSTATFTPLPSLQTSRQTPGHNINPDLGVELSFAPPKAGTQQQQVAGAWQNTKENGRENAREDSRSSPGQPSTSYASLESEPRPRWGSPASPRGVASSPPGSPRGTSRTPLDQQPWQTHPRTPNLQSGGSGGSPRQTLRLGASLGTQSPMRQSLTRQSPAYRSPSGLPRSRSRSPGSPRRPQGGSFGGSGGLFGGGACYCGQLGGCDGSCQGRFDEPRAWSPTFFGDGDLAAASLLGSDGLDAEQKRAEDKLLFEAVVREVSRRFSFLGGYILVSRGFR